MSNQTTSTYTTIAQRKAAREAAWDAYEKAHAAFLAAVDEGRDHVTLLAVAADAHAVAENLSQRAMLAGEWDL